MMKFFPFAMITVLFFTSCSMKTPPNQWEYKAKNATQSYIKNYLSDKELLAVKDYERAIEHAKSGADLVVLGKIYLTKCAMEKIVGISTNCGEYEMIESTLLNPNLTAYKNLIKGNISEDEIQNLPQKYHLFAQYLITKNNLKAIQTAINTKEVISMLLMVSLVQENLKVDDIDKIIAISSFYGYAKVSKHWLEYKAVKFEDKKAENILKAIEK